MEIKKYEEMSREELVAACYEKDAALKECLEQSQKSSFTIYNKKDIMDLFKCESNKALGLMKLLFQMNYGNKIGKEYYVMKNKLDEFMGTFSGKEVAV